MMNVIRLSGLCICLGCLGCLQAERSNPIDSNPASLFAARPSVFAPKGAERWYAGDTHRIQWAPGDVAADSTISLRLSTDGGTTFSHSIADRIRNTGAYLWTVPDLPSKQCRVQLVSVDSLIVNNAVFSILSKPIPIQLTFGGGEWPSWRNERMAFMSDRLGNYDIWVLEGASLIRVTDDEGFDGYPAFDKKGFHLAFTSDRTGRNEVWATGRFAGVPNAVPVQLTTDGGSYPAWQPLPNARRLVFILNLEGGMNIATLIFSSPLTTGTVVDMPRFRANDGRKERPSWIIDPANREFIYYKDPPTSTLRRIRIEDTREYLPPENLRLPFTSPVHNPSVSPSTSKIAVSVEGDIWVVSLENGKVVGEPLQITFDPADDDVPDWRSNSELAFQSNRTGWWEIWSVTVPD